MAASVKLESCSKKELLYLISKNGLPEGHFEEDILFFRYHEANRKAIEESKKAAEHLEIYIDLLEPYRGKPAVDIPDDIYKNAETAYSRCKAHQKKSQTYRQKWQHIRNQIQLFNQSRTATK